MSDKPLRSLAKAISWRLTGSLATMILFYIFTGKIKFAVSVGIVELFGKTGLYFVHERLWDRIQIGKKKEPEFHI